MLRHTTGAELSPYPLARTMEQAFELVAPRLQHVSAHRKVNVRWTHVLGVVWRACHELACYREVLLRFEGLGIGFSIASLDDLWLLAQAFMQTSSRVAPSSLDMKARVALYEESLRMRQKLLAASERQRAREKSARGAGNTSARKAEELTCGGFIRWRATSAFSALTPRPTGSLRALPRSPRAT